MAEEADHGIADGTHAPEGSYWPIALAMALTVAVAGLVVHTAVAVVGLALCLVVMAAWVLQKHNGPSPFRRGLTEAIHLATPSADGAEFTAPLARGRTLGWWGLVLFIASEAIFFANLIGAYLYLRIGSQGSPIAVAHPDLLFPSVNTAILLLSGLPAHFAHRSIKKGNRLGLQIGLILAALLGAVFLAGQVYEYSTAGFTLQTSVLAAGFFVLTGFHGAHVAVGIGLLLATLALSLRGRFSARSNFGVEVAATYWHFVDVVWIFLFAILYLA